MLISTDTRVPEKDCVPINGAASLQDPAGEGTNTTKDVGVRSVSLAMVRNILLSVLLTLVLCESLARLFISYSQPPQFGSFEYDSKYIAATATKPATNKRSVVFVGTSYTSRAVYAELLHSLLAERGLDLDIYNFASSGSWPKDELFLIESAIKNGASPALIVYDVTPAVLHCRSDIFRGHSALLSSSYMGQYLIPKERSYIERARAWAQKHFYLVRYRSFLHTRLLEIPGRILNPDRTLLNWRPGAVQKESSPEGWAPAYNIADEKALQLSVLERAAMVKFMHGAESSNSDSIIVPELKKFCTDKNIPLLLVWYPVHGESTEFHEKAFGDTPGKLATRLSEASRKSGALFLDLHEDSDQSHFFNCDHLNATGAISVTRRLADYFSTGPLRPLLESQKGGGGK